MNRLGPAWRETLVLAALAVLVWAAVPGSQTRIARDERRPLVAGPVERVRVGLADCDYLVDLDAERPLLRDGDGGLLGRCDREEAAAIRASLVDCERLRRIPMAALDAAQTERMGLDARISVQLGEQRFTLATARSDRGYLVTDAAYEVLSTDPAALLGRHPDTLREARIGLPAIVRELTHEKQGDQWSVELREGRWWLHAEALATPPTGAWTDQEVVNFWVRSLAEAPIIRYQDAADDRIERIDIQITGSDRRGRPQTVRLTDCGPAGGGRLIRRREQLGEVVLDEWLVLRADPVLFDPDPAHLRSQTLLPIDPRDADRVVVGELRFSRVGNRWRVNGSDDVDQPKVQQFLAALAQLPAATPEQRLPGPGGIRLIQGDLDFRLRHGDRRLAGIIDQAHGWHFRNRYLVPGVEVGAVIGLVFSPSDGAPQVYSRDSHEPWPAEIAVEVEDFIARLLGARVRQWNGPLAEGEAIPFSVESTISVATATTHYSIKLDSLGRVAIPERGLVGQLDAASQDALFGDR